MRVDEQALRDFIDAYQAAFDEQISADDASLLLGQLAEFYRRVATAISDEDPSL